MAVDKCAKGFAGVELERETGFEPATFGLGSHCSTTELLPLVSQIIELHSQPGKLTAMAVRKKLAVVSRYKS